MYEFAFVLAYGSEANSMDTTIKEFLLNFTQECSDSRHLALENSVYEKDRKTYILVKQEDETYLCFNNDKIYKSLDGFTDKNKEIISKQGDLKNEIGIAIERLDYKLGN